MSRAFEDGRQVRVKAFHPPGHCRTPHYTRGRQGTVLGVIDRQPNPQELAYGRNGLPPVSLSVGAFGRDIPLGLGSRIELRDLRPFFHDFLGEPTCTASALARYVSALGAPVELGRVFIDYRGAHFLRFLGSGDPHAATGPGGAR